jgi:transcription termination factor Rho
MPVLSRDALEDSPLADLHLLGGELGIDGFRRLRKADLVDAILERQGGDDSSSSGPPDADGDDDEAPKPRRGRPRRPRPLAPQPPTTTATATATPPTRSRSSPPDADTDSGDEDERPRRRRGGRGRSSRDRDRDRGGDRGRDRDEPQADAEPDEERSAEGTVELLPNGSGFVRVSPPEPSDDDVYISAAQVRRCELVTGDTVSGPMRPPRRSERYPSLVRVDTINGRSADEVAEGTPFDDLPAAFPNERLALGSEDPTLKAIEWLTPLGRGSRATIVGGARAGKTEALRRLASTLSSQEDLELTVVLAGAGPRSSATGRPPISSRRPR